MLHATLLRHFIFILLIFFASCKVTQKNVYGHFVLNKGINTYLNFDTSGHFVYIQRNPIKSLLHKGDYVMTEGTWTFHDSGYIILNSLTENKNYKQVTVRQVDRASISSFTFYDMAGDTLPIVGATKNGQWFGRVHNLMKSFELKLSKSDTVTADLIGYNKFKFDYSDTSQFVYQVELYPNYISDYFKNKKLLLKKNKLIDIELNETYKKLNGCLQHEACWHSG